jgi:fused signal recognition particle receptor
MLGWFKKKFSKKEDSTLPVQDPLAGQQSLTPEQPPEISSTSEQQQKQEEPGKVPGTGSAVTATPVPEASSMFKRLSERLAKTRDSFIYRMDTLFLGKKVIDAKLLDDLEELLITADLGVATVTELLDHARRKLKRNELSDPASLKEVLREKIRAFITDSIRPAELVMPASGPFVIMVIGVNGVGKTTTIGKIAHKFLSSGQSVMLVAADTFRAAAVAQLQIWGERNKIKVVSHKEGADPSSVVYDALAIAKADNTDVVLVDTAGRLHTHTNLMEELKKIKRVMAKQLPGAPHEVMLVIDATTGQNGISQAKLFNEAVEVTGITLTKLDGTAKGGIVANICRDLKIPLRFIGIGEHLEDLRDFDPDEFIEALFQKRTDGSTQTAA